MKHNNKQTAEFFVFGKAAKGNNFETDGTIATSCTSTIAGKQKGVILIALCYRACNQCGRFFGQTATTERQKSYIKRAANTIGVDWYEVPHAFANTRKEHEVNWEYLQGTYREYESKAHNARKDCTYFNYLRLAKSAKVAADNYWKLFCEE